MAYIETMQPSAATGEVRQMYERQQASWGYVPNYAKVFSHRPEVMARWAGLLSGIRRNVDSRRFELVTLAAALALRNSYCCLAHGNALTAFYAPETVRAIADGDLRCLSAADGAMMAFAQKVATDAAAVTADDVAALRDHGYADDEIFDIAATAAGRAFFTKLLDALGAEADGAYLEMDEALRESLLVGRPIDADGPARLDAPAAV
jgi:uncharacterized peroxidase-related enzyme